MTRILAMNVVGAVNAIAAAGGFAAIGGLIWLATRGNPERHAEEDARAHFDLHGRWPDDGRDP
ncbi:MAG: hypothetical protein NVSMB25_05610 [Thermoleophilaceae bacterium]